MHDRDLSGRPAEAEQGDAQPDLERFGETDAMRRHDLIRQMTGTVGLAVALMRDLRRRRRPVMGFADRIARPTIESIVEREARIELHEIVLVHARQAERCREQAGGLRRKIETCGIGGAHDEGEAVERFAVQAEFLDHHIEGAELAAVAPEDPFDVERRCTKSVRDIRDLGGRDEKEDGGRIDETADEPRASEPRFIVRSASDANGFQC